MTPRESRSKRCASREGRAYVGYRDLAKLALAIERQTTVHTIIDTPALEVAATAV